MAVGNLNQNGPPAPPPPPPPPVPPLPPSARFNGTMTKLHKQNSNTNSAADVSSERTEDLGEEFNEKWEEILEKMSHFLESEPLNSSDLLIEIPPNEDEIFKAVRYSNCWMIGRLVRQGLDINCRHEDGTCSVKSRPLQQHILMKAYTPLHVAVLHSDLRTIHYLVHLGADINKVDKNDRTPLHYAANVGRNDVVKYLTLNGADLNVQSSSKKTPLMFAVLRRDPTLQQILIDAGADVNIQDDNGTSALHKVVFSNLNAAYNVRALIRGGADVNIKNRMGATPLLMAIPFRNVDVIRLLLEAGADVNHADIKLKTPIHYIYMDSVLHTPLIRLLLNYGADINHKDKSGKSPLMLSIQFSRMDAIIQLLKLYDCYRDTNILNCDKMKQLRADYPMFNEMIDKELREPWTLLRFSRYAIRNNTNSKSMKDLETLMLPRTLKDYLQYK